MSPRVGVRLDANGEDAVAVKAATTPGEIAALAHEAERLALASHPGVVALVEHRETDDGAELITRFAGEPLDRWRGTLVRLAGLGAAIAATLADLHEMGIVHGRLDATHVLLAGDGRPRLCGLSHAGEAKPADDVAALGALLAKLLTQTRPAPRHGGIAWRRGPHAERRAVEQVLDHARDPVPSRRLSARGFATALLAAMPGAELPPSGGHMSPAWRPAAAPETGNDDTVVHHPAAADDATLSRRELFDDFFGDQTAADLDDLFADRPWTTRSHASPRRARPPRPEPEPARAGRRLGVLAAAAGALALGGWWATSRQPHDAAATQDSASQSAVPPPCPAPPTTADGAGAAATVSEIDVDGDGCPEPVLVDAGVVQVADSRWAVGHPDDELALGDWDCDGTVTPALYRPATGDVFVFPTWAGPGEPLTVDAVTQVSGGHALTTASDGAGAGRCDVPVVELADGAQHAVEVAEAAP
jgi:eukaryotic-like serine/threonine-protein kinase